MRRTLDVTVQIQLDAAGNGTASIGPTGMRETWSPDIATIKVAPATQESKCAVYVGDRVTSLNFRDATATGSSGNATSRIDGTLKVPGKVWAVWVGGTPNALATLNVRGVTDV